MDTQKIDINKLSAQQIIDEADNEKLTSKEIKEVEAKVDKEIEREVKEIVSSLK